MNKDFYKSIKSLSYRYVPRWIIICIDLFLVLISIMLTHYLVMGLKEHGYPSAFLSPLQYFLIVVVHLFSFFIFRSYSGIIRHSTFIDALKLAGSIFMALLILIVINYVTRFYFINRLFLTTELLIGSFFSFSMLFSFRLFVKQLFTLFKKAAEENVLVKKVLILGFNENSVAIANAIDKESPKRFLLKSFVNSKKRNKVTNLRVLGKKIKYLNTSNSIINEIVQSKVNGVILSDPKLSSLKLFEIVDFCTKNRIQIFKAPLVSNSKNNFSSKKIEAIRIEDLLDRAPIKLGDENKIVEFNNKIILVTGAAGSIGSEIVRQLASCSPKKIVVLDQAETPLHNLSIELQSAFENIDFEFIVGNVSNFNKLDSVFNNYKFDIVFHAAAYKHVPLMELNPIEAINVNILGTKNLADLSVKYKVSKFVMVSTDKAVNPSNVMGASKRVAEMCVQSLYYNNKKSTKFITTRFGNVLGSNGSVVPLFKKQIEKGGPVTITHPDIIRYFMTIPEACNLVLEAGTMGNGGEIYLFDMGAPVKIMDLAKRMIRLYGYEPGIDINIKITGLRKGEKLYEELLSDESKTLPTHNKKIMIAKDDLQNCNEILLKVKGIIESSEMLNKKESVKKIKELVPEYKSLNSEYEVLDNNIKK